MISPKRYLRVLFKLYTMIMIIKFDHRTSDPPKAPWTLLPDNCTARWRLCADRPRWKGRSYSNPEDRISSAPRPPRGSSKGKIESPWTPPPCCTSPTFPGWSCPKLCEAKKNPQLLSCQPNIILTREKIFFEGENDTQWPMVKKLVEIELSMLGREGKISRKFFLFFFWSEKDWRTCCD